jgi:hypothetical protein
VGFLGDGVQFFLGRGVTVKVRSEQKGSEVKVGFRLGRSRLAHPAALDFNARNAVRKMGSATEEDFVIIGSFVAACAGPEERFNERIMNHVRSGLT